MSSLKRELIGDDAAAYLCECGAPIHTPGLCPDCEREFEREFDLQEKDREDFPAAVDRRAPRLAARNNP